MAKGDYALTVPQIRRAAELYADGYSRRQIAAYFGCSDTAAGNALRLAGVQFRDRKSAAILGLQHWMKSRRTTTFGPPSTSQPRTAMNAMQTAGDGMGRHQYKEKPCTA
jgi:hypothetical protein